ncbi:MAG TPA: hypothetical protein VG873_16080 [Burkholderiales bacterium]|nr:hypothetical protein [Burkholderiales bacterium]
MEELHETQQYAAKQFGAERRLAHCAYEGPDRRKARATDDERLEQQEQLRQQDQDRPPETD